MNQKLYKLRKLRHYVLEQTEQFADTPKVLPNALQSEGSLSEPVTDVSANNRDRDVPINTSEYEYNFSLVIVDVFCVLLNFILYS
jgi:hypothetical protein